MTSTTLKDFDTLVERKKPRVALPVSPEMQKDILNNPDDISLSVRRKDGTTRIERVRFVLPDALMEKVAE